MTKRLAIFLHQPKCSVQSCNGLIKALSPHYTFKVFTKHEIEDKFFKDVDMVVIPGGVGDSDSFDNLMKINGRSIKRFVKRGGKYLGICMGAYWAGQHYFDLLEDIEVVQYIKRPRSDTKRPHAKACEIKWLGQPQKMYFYDGCALVGQRSSFQTVATYANGDPMAIIKDNIGLIGCHPESEYSWYAEYSWMPRHWHKGKHHKLLLDFVDSMMKV